MITSRPTRRGHNPEKVAGYFADKMKVSSWKFGEIRLGERKGYPVNDLGQ